jgi:hypothetical protein
MEGMKTVGLLALLAMPASAQFGAGVEYTAPPPETVARPEVGQAAALGDQTDKLKDALSNPSVSQADLHERAGALFGGMERPEASRMGSVDLRGWDKPDRSTEDSIDGMVDRAGRTIAAANFNPRSSVPPDPELASAWNYGRALNSNGMTGYDQDGKLGRGVLGAYLYNKTSAIGILFNEKFQTIQRYLGDQFAAATMVHESAHARDRENGRLNPQEVKKGETQAFETEFKYLRLVDPTGQRLAWSRVNFCAPTSPAPKLVCDYLTHLAKISYYGEKNDWDGLVTSLGYEDQPGNPLPHHHHGEQDGD